MINQTMMAILLLASVAVVIGGLAVIPTLELQQQVAEARPNSPVKSCDPFYRAFNASQGRCFNP